jgi:hypothetical protein
MIRRFLNILRGKGAARRSGLYSLHKYLDDAGNFDYEKYRLAQTAANKRKLDHVWVQEENILFLSEYIRQRIPAPQFGICHGTRRGLEQRWFRENLGCEVIGTEISDTASDFPHTIRWDFHDVKPEWIDGVDFIYSNSMDHSYDPKKCLDAWVSCLKPNGLLFIEHSTADIEARESDPFGVHLIYLPYLVLVWSKGAYCVTSILDAPVQSKFRDTGYETNFLVIQKCAHTPMT